MNHGYIEYTSHWERYYVFIWGCLTIIMASWMGIHIVSRERNRPFSRLSVWAMGVSTMPLALVVGWLVPAPHSLPLLPHVLQALVLGWMILVMAHALLSLIIISIGEMIWDWDTPSPPH